MTVLLAGCGSASGGSDSIAIHGAGDLRWAPPQLSEPTTIRLPASGCTETRLDPDRDYVVVLPQRPKRGGVTLVGGHNVVLVGGEITVTGGSDRCRRALYIKDATGTVHVEGVLLDAVGRTGWDGVDISAPAATVQLQRLRVERVQGGFDSFHGDVVQPWGGVGDLRIDRLSASSNYQGLMIPIDLGEIGRAEISRVDLRPLVHEPGRGKLLWLTSGASGCRTYPISLRRVFVEPDPGRPLADSLWPGRDRPAGCGARTRRGIATWPGLPQVQGEVEVGRPPAGPFVPPGSAGIDYAQGLPALG